MLTYLSHRPHQDELNREVALPGLLTLLTGEQGGGGPGAQRGRWQGAISLASNPNCVIRLCSQVRRAQGEVVQKFPADHKEHSHQWGDPKWTWVLPRTHCARLAHSSPQALMGKHVEASP